jgi:dUTP pyrophosphatase
MKFRNTDICVAYQTPDSAGFDIKATQGGVIPPGKIEVFSTGLFLDITESGEDEALLILPRSGLAVKHKITVLNSPGLIDNLYPEEIKVILINHGECDFIVKVGDRIAQGVVINFKKMIGADIKTTARTSGFGSTGT